MFVEVHVNNVFFFFIRIFILFLFFINKPEGFRLQARFKQKLPSLRITTTSFAHPLNPAHSANLFLSKH